MARTSCLWTQGCTVCWPARILCSQDTTDLGEKGRFKMIFIYRQLSNNTKYYFKLSCITGFKSVGGDGVLVWENNTFTHKFIHTGATSLLKEDVLWIIFRPGCLWRELWQYWRDRTRYWQTILTAPSTSMYTCTIAFSLSRTLFVLVKHQKMCLDFRQSLVVSYSALFMLVKCFQQSCWGWLINSHLM